jgi:hypothetical protein
VIGPLPAANNVVNVSSTTEFPQYVGICNKSVGQICNVPYVSYGTSSTPLDLWFAFWRSRRRLLASDILIVNRSGAKRFAQQSKRTSHDAKAIAVGRRRRAGP